MITSFSAGCLSRLIIGKFKLFITCRLESGTGITVKFEIFDSDEADSENKICSSGSPEMHIFYCYSSFSLSLLYSRFNLFASRCLMIQKESWI